MRPVLHGDVVSAARLVYTIPAGERTAALSKLLARAEAADLYRRKHGRAHPRWGDGSLMAVAQRRELPNEPTLRDSDYCRCLSTVFLALAAWSERMSDPGRAAK